MVHCICYVAPAFIHTPVISVHVHYLKCWLTCLNVDMLAVNSEWRSAINGSPLTTACAGSSSSSPRIATSSSLHTQIALNDTLSSTLVGLCSWHTTPLTSQLTLKGYDSNAIPPSLYCMWLEVAPPLRMTCSLT